MPKDSEMPNPIDRNIQGLIGKPVDRVEGPLKVTGKATYAYEYQMADQKAAYGYIVGADIAKGKIKSIDTSAAENTYGVLLVMTHKNAPKQKGSKPTFEKAFDDPKPYLFDDKVRYYGEPVALVVAETFEQARAAAAVVRVIYAQEQGRFHTEPYKNNAYMPKPSNGQPADSKIGDFEKSFADAPVKLDETYKTPIQNHNAMELHASIAEWQGKKLTVYSAQQLPVEAHKTIASTHGVDKDDLKVICKYVGGGFGGKLPLLADAMLSIMAAKVLKRPVKTSLTRQQTFANATHRTETIQQIRLGAENDGTLTSIAHQCWSETSTFDEYLESSAACTRNLYAAPNRLTTHRLVKLDLPPTGSMRAPGEATGMMAIEQAMDEMAEKLGMDPIEFRIKNEPTKDPEKQLPFSTRDLVKCLREGAEKFGWHNRKTQPATTRDGKWLVGYGVASAIRNNYMRPATTRISIDTKGHVTAKMAMTDIGTGTYTIMTQIAAETMGLPLESVTIVMGDSSLPPTPGSGGSWGANSVGSSVYLACMELREKLAKLAVKNKNSTLYGLDEKTADFKEGKVVIDGKTEDFATIAARESDPIELETDSKPPETYKTYAQAAYGAHFAEVGVHIDTGEIRLRRMLGVFTAGRILNEKTANSQAVGGMIWGLGSALHEESIVDHRWGNFVNHDLAEYHVPVNADIKNVEAVFLSEVDDKTGPLKIKGVGELGICGSGAAVANAVYNACGVRVRQYPITLDKILPGLPKEI